MVYGITSYYLGKNQKINIPSIKGTADTNDLSAPINSPVPFADTQVTTIYTSHVKLCSNTTLGFEVSYPKDWFTTYNSESEKCTFFAPYSFVVVQSSQDFQVPIKIEVTSPEDWSVNLKFQQNPNDLQNVISTENTQIGERLAIKIEAQSTGLGQLPRGLVKTTYLIYDSLKPTILSYQQLDEKENVAENKSILEDMVTSLKIF